MRIPVSGLLAALLVVPCAALADEVPPPGTPLSAVAPSANPTPGSGTGQAPTPTASEPVPPPGTPLTAVAPSNNPAPNPGTGQTNQPTPTEAPKLLPIPFEYTFHGFVKGGYSFVPYNGNVSQIIGHDSGFRLYDARLEFSGAFGKWVDFVISVDTTTTITPATGASPSMIGFEDAYTTLHLGEAYLRLGQFKTPFNGEFLLDDQFIPFVRRSAVTEGLLADESQNPTNGILLDRQLGAMIGGRIGLGGTLGLNGAFAVTNGDGITQGANDNTKVALAARSWLGSEHFTVGISGFWNDTTAAQTLAQRSDTRNLGADFDFLIDLRVAHRTGLKIFGMAEYQYVESLTVAANAPINMFGAVASASLPIDFSRIVIEPALRYSYFQPNSTIRAAADEANPTATSPFVVQDVTLGVNVSPRVVPLRFQINYTYRAAASIWEEPGTLFQAVVQANF